MAGHDSDTPASTRPSPTKFPPSAVTEVGCVALQVASGPQHGTVTATVMAMPIRILLTRHALLVRGTRSYFFHTMVLALPLASASGDLRASAESESASIMIPGA